ncbi:MAG: PAS domain S-box protein [Rhodocyclaceae bacterium]
MNLFSKGGTAPGTQPAHLREAQRIGEMGSWELDLASATIKWSDEVYRIFGISPETFEHTLDSFLALVAETDRPRVRTAIEKMIDEGQGALEFSLVRGDGQSHEMLCRGEALCETPGKVSALIGTVRDVTEQRTAERALAQSEEKLRAITDNVNTVMFLKDTAGRYLHINRQYEKMFHISNEAIQGKTDHDISPHDMADAFVEHDQMVIQSGSSLEIEEQVPHDEGLHYYLSVKFPIRNAAGEIYAVCGIATDITERKRAELMTSKLLQRNQVLMQNALDGIHILNGQGQLLEANDSFCRLLGYTADEVTQLNLADWEAKMPADERERLLATLLDGGHAVFETLNRRKDGQVIDVEVSAVGIELAGEKFLYAASREITERKHIQQQLEHLVQQRTAELSEALQAAKVADQAKNAFLANITHELRTPLSAMIGFSGLARPFSSDPQQRAYLDKIISAGKTLSGVINDLLDLSKIAAGHMQLESVTFSLRQLLSRSSSVMSYKAEEKGLDLTEHIDDDVPDTLLGDPLRVEQILLNLLSNAVKFTSSGRVEIRIGLETREARHVCLAIEVEDSGIGLREEEMALLFKSFSQADASMSRKFGGTGLGLAICKHLSEMMGGEISVRSREGCGTTFRVKLRLALGDANELAARQPVDRTTLPASYQGARVLVVDDQPFNREVVAGLLAVVGVVPRMASNGQEALDLLNAAGPAAFDLVLMDVQMPVMDGLTATRLIRKLDGFGQLPIIAMTAHTMTHEKDIGSAAGMNEHIGKPFDDLAFYSVLAKWIPSGKHQAQPAAAIRLRPAADDTLPAMQGIDTRAGLALFVGDETRYRFWLNNFVEEAPRYLSEIRQALSNRQAAEAAALAHTLKGRGGMLGMHELLRIASRLEAAIDTGTPADRLQAELTGLDQVVRSLGEEISRAFKLPRNTSTFPLPVLEKLPAGPPPGAIAQLIALLETGNSDCDKALADCQEELGDTPWAPYLQQVSVHVKNFDYGAACKLLCGARQDPGQGK